MLPYGRRTCAATAALSLAVAQGCTTFQPARSGGPAPGRAVEFRFARPPALALGPGAAAARVERLTGSVLTESADTLWVRPRQARVERVASDGIVVGVHTVRKGLDSRVAVPRVLPGMEVFEQRVSALRTAAFVAGIGLALVAVLAASGADEFEWESGNGGGTF